MSLINGYYMTRPEEIAKHAELCRRNGEEAPELGSYTVIEAMAGGSPGLFEALWSFWDFEHAVDDLIDGSGWSPDMIEAALLALYEEVLRKLGFPTERKHVSDWTKTFCALLTGAQWEKTRRALAMEAEWKFFTALRENPLYRDNPGDFRALFAQCIFRVLDGDAMAGSGDARKAALAPAVKCGDLEVMFHLVLLAHGWGRARQVSCLRDYDQPDTEVK